MLLLESVIYAITNLIFSKIFQILISLYHYFFFKKVFQFFEYYFKNLILYFLSKQTVIIRFCFQSFILIPLLIVLFFIWLFFQVEIENFKDFLVNLFIIHYLNHNFILNFYYIPIWQLLLLFYFFLSQTVHSFNKF